MKLLLSLLAAVSIQAAYAQDFDRMFYVSWDVNTPLSNTDDWISGTSSRGLKLGYKKLINDNFTMGFDLGWSVYSEYQPTTTFVSEDGAFTTDYFKYQYVYELALSGQYYLPWRTRKVMPYVGLGVGAALSRYIIYYNVYSEGEDVWGLLVNPEMGVLFPFGGKVGAMVGAHYNFTTSDSEYFGLDRFNHFGAQVGIVFMSY